MSEQKPLWEKVAYECDRMGVDGGWLYRTWRTVSVFDYYKGSINEKRDIAVCFVPTPKEVPSE